MHALGFALGSARGEALLVPKFPHHQWLAHCWSTWSREDSLCCTIQSGSCQPQEILDTWNAVGPNCDMLSAKGLPWWFSGKESACNAGAARDSRAIPGSGRCPGKGNGNSLQYSCLENPMDRGAWQAIVHRIAKSQTRLTRLSSSSSILC